MNDDMLLKLISEREQQLEAEAAAAEEPFTDVERCDAIRMLIQRARGDAAARARLEQAGAILGESFTAAMREWLTTPPPPA